MVKADAGPTTATGHDLHACTLPAFSQAVPQTWLQIALDGEVVYGEAMVSSEHITGEALPRQCRRGDAVPAGALNHDGVLVVKAQRPSADSTPARIARLTAEAQVGSAGFACSGWSPVAGAGTPARTARHGLVAPKVVSWTV